MKKTRELKIWLDEVREEMVRRGVSSDLATIATADYHDWLDYYDFGVSPEDAAVEEMSYWEPTATPTED